MQRNILTRSLGAFLVAGGAASIFMMGHAIRPPLQDLPPLFNEVVVVAQNDDGEANAPQLIGDEPDVTSSVVAIRAIAPDEIAPPPVNLAVLERLEPRAPLSEIGLAAAPLGPRDPEIWLGTLARPVATAAGVLEEKTWVITIADVVPVEPDEVCEWRGKPWPCGAQARTAFRSWLRGRTVVCDAPPQSLQQEFTVPCRVGKSDVGQWLVENGWVKAAEDGPFAKAGRKAQKNHRGIFGKPPAIAPEDAPEASAALATPKA